MEMTPERWRATSAYLISVFGESDPHLAGLMDEAGAAGMPPIAVSADVGRFRTLLTSMTEARLAVEVGTLAGYSAIWLARGLRPDGRLITIEPEEKHAAFAEAQLAKAPHARFRSRFRGGRRSPPRRAAHRPTTHHG